jgi:hypothetical protein
VEYVQFAERYDWPPPVVDALPKQLREDWWPLVETLEEVANERSGRQPPADGGPG